MLQLWLLVLIGIIFEILIAKLISIFKKGCRRTEHRIKLVVIVVVSTAIPAET